MRPEWEQVSRVEGHGPAVVSRRVKREVSSKCHGEMGVTVDRLTVAGGRGRQGGCSVAGAVRDVGIIGLIQLQACRISRQDVARGL